MAGTGKIKTWLINQLGGLTEEEHQDLLIFNQNRMRAESKLREELQTQFLSLTCRELDGKIKCLNSTVQQLLNERERLVVQARTNQALTDQFRQALYRLTKGMPVLVVLMPTDIVGPQDLTESAQGLKPVYPWMIGQPAGFSRLMIRRLTSG